MSSADKLISLRQCQSSRIVQLSSTEFISTGHKLYLHCQFGEGLKLTIGTTIRPHIRSMTSSDQLDLLGFEDPSSAPLPQGVRYAAEVLSAAEEKAAAAAVATLDLKRFAYRGFLGNRRTASFGWRYDFNGGGFQKGDPIPAALLPFREIAAEFAGIPPESLEQLLAIEYSPGAGIGWHRDRPQFGVVVALSLLAPFRMRFRRKAGERWDTRDQVLGPRSAYLLDGPGRTEWSTPSPPWTCFVTR